MRAHGIVKDTGVGSASTVDKAMDCIVVPGEVTTVLVEVLTGVIESELELVQ